MKEQDKAESVVRFYMLCGRLKKLIRTGWVNWNIKAERIESVAEHIYGVQMLALAMKSQYGYENIDMAKVITMLAVHELEEILIGDLTFYQISREEKEIIGHKAVNKVLCGLIDKEKIASLVNEFDAKQTDEAKFAYQCDKLECDLQSKVYDMETTIPHDAKSLENLKFLGKDAKELFAQGKTFSQTWMELGRKRYHYDQNFTEVSEYAESINSQNISRFDNLVK